MEKKQCEQCREFYTPCRGRRKFCSRSCAGRFSATGRVCTEETRAKISENSTSYYAQKANRAKHSKIVGEHTRTVWRKAPRNIYDVSSRTKNKILRRLDLSCTACGWNLAICDLHHLRGRRVENPHRHTNLVYLCPNCHRLAHESIIDAHRLPTLQDLVGDKWRWEYYGGNPDDVKECTCGNVYIGSCSCSTRRRLGSKECRICGCAISSRSIYCRPCFSLSRRGTGTKIDWPPDEELKAMIQRLPMTSVGKELGVSDNAVRKRLKSRGILHR